MASTRTARPLSTHLRRASRVALKTASTSFPSTRIVSTPYPGPRDAMPSPWYCSLEGVDMANPLLRTKNSVGEGIVDASNIPAWKSPSEAAPDILTNIRKWLLDEATHRIANLPPYKQPRNPFLVDQDHALMHNLHPRLGEFEFRVGRK